MQKVQHFYVEDKKKIAYRSEFTKTRCFGWKFSIFPSSSPVGRGTIMEFGEAIKNPAYRIFQTEYSGCLDISAHA